MKKSSLSVHTFSFTQMFIDNSGKMIDLYQKTLDDLEKRYEEKFVQLKETYDLKIQSLNHQIETLKMQHDECTRNYEVLKTEIQSK